MPSISKGELALELSEGGTIGDLGQNEHTALEGRGNVGEIYAKLIGLNFATEGNELAALAAVSIREISGAIVNLIEDLTASYVPGELDVVKRAVIEGPDAFDEELLDVSFLFRIGTRLDASDDGLNFIGARTLGDFDAVAGLRVNLQRFFGDSNGGESGSDVGLNRLEGVGGG